MSQQKHGQISPKMLYMVTFPKTMIYSFYFHWTKFTKTVSLGLHFNIYLLEGIIRIKHLYSKFWSRTSFVAFKRLVYTVCCSSLDYNNPPWVSI